MVEEETVDSISRAAEAGLNLIEADLEDIVVLPPCSNFVLKRRRRGRRRKMFAMCKGEQNFKFIHLDKLMDELESLGEKEVS